ncbi:MAG: GspH/FimT family pseudopilin [Pseudomonadales bacterium]
MFIFKLISSKNPSNISSTHGWTLIELITVLAVFILLTGIGTPNLNKWLQHQTESTVFNTLYHLCVFARTLAVKENHYLTLCASEDLKHCGGPWNKTIIVFSDFNKNETVDENEQLFRAITLPKTTPCLEWNASAHRQYLQFKPSGATNGTAGHFKFCDTVINAIQKKIVVSFNGRTSLKSL